MTVTATPLTPPFGDSGRQGRVVVTFVEGRSPSQNLWSMCILCAYAIMTTQSIISEKLTFFMLFCIIREIFVFC